MRKTGLMGGTFNPIHNGHLMLAEAALAQFRLDEVIFMPSGVPYTKSAAEVLPGRIRAEMTALAIRKQPRFSLSVMEIEQDGNTYTYRTLEQLRTEHPDTEYYFIVGADSLFHMKDWRCPERIFANCTVLAAVRGAERTMDLERQARILKEEYGAEIRILDTKPVDISSSDIRRRIAAGESAAWEVPEAVLTYIEKRGLYR